MEPVPRYTGCSIAPYGFGFSIVSRSRWKYATCLEGNLAPFWSNQSATCSFCFAHTCCFPAGKGNRLWICPLASCFDDLYAHACTGLDGVGKWFQLFDWRNICPDVYSGVLPDHCLLATDAYQWEDRSGFFKLEHEVGCFILWLVSSSGIKSRLDCLL